MVDGHHMPGLDRRMRPPAVALSGMGGGWGRDGGGDLTNVQ
jgi:hypothetical protein